MRALNSNWLKQLSTTGTTAKTVTEFLQVLCTETPVISELNFRTYLLAPRLDERVRKEEVIEDAVLAKAEQFKSAYGGSLWDAALRILMHKGDYLPESLLSQAIIHKHNPRERSFSITNEEFVMHGAGSIIKSLEDDEGLAICSRVRVRNGYSAHLPMLDFACKPTKANCGAVEYMLRAIDQSGIVLNSGDSYHFIGISLLTADEWLRFMGQSLLLTPLIDARYMGHRLYDGECYLRVFAKNKPLNEPLIESLVFTD